MTILSFCEETDADAIGNKGLALCRLAKAGLPVPACFCVSVEGMNTIGIGDIGVALARLRTNSVAVRSSAVEEDRAAGSFAGIYVTRLNVIGADNVKRALEEIRESATNPAAMVYRQRRGMPDRPRMAAVVQKFLTAETSGVIFTKDPIDGSDKVTIEACWGLGEALAGGTVTPDRWLLSRDGVVMSSSIADKDVAIVPDEAGGTKQIDVDPDRRLRPCLSVDSLRHLLKLALECERLFGAPQDIEWAVASDDVWLLQSRHRASVDLVLRVLRERVFPSC